MEDDAEQQAAWERLYAGQARPWRGVVDVGLPALPVGSPVLDLGCGNGKTAEALCERGFAVTGVDYAPAAVVSCRRQLGGRAAFLVADCRALPFPDGSFAAVTAVHLLEHLPPEDAPLALQEAGRVLRPGGFLLVRSFAAGDMRAEGQAERGRNGLRYRYYDEEELLALAAGLETVRVATLREPTRFGTVRVRVEGLFRRPAGPSKRLNIPEECQTQK